MVRRATRLPGSGGMCGFLVNFSGGESIPAELSFGPLCQPLFLHLISTHRLREKAPATTDSSMRVAIAWRAADIFSLQAG